MRANHHISRIVGWLGTLVATACLIASAPASAYLLNSAEATQALNLQREANGIPAGITDRPEWDEACAAHLNWLTLNPSAWQTNPHVEIPGTPGYTEAGASAGLHSDLLGQLVLLSESPGWYDGWEEAPYHLFSLMTPSLTEIGYVPNCVVVAGGTLRPEPVTPQILTYPGNNTDFIRAWEKAEEWPDTPAPRAGLTEGKITGPYLLVYPWGAGNGEITGATLSGPAGPVEVRIVSSPGAGGFLIPPEPLTVGATYTASVTYTPASVEAGGSGAPPIIHEWSFTAARPGRVVESPIIGPPMPAPAKAGGSADTPITPSHAVVAHIARISHDTRHGTAVITVLLNTSAPGTAELWGTGVKPVYERFTHGTTIKLTVMPTGKMAKRLHRDGRATVPVHISLTQVGATGTAVSQIVTLVRGHSR